MENCAHCSRFPCDFLNDHYLWNREYFEKKHGEPISDEDYLMFIELFEGLKRLQSTRKTIRQQDLVEPPEIPPLKTKIVDFPKDLPFSGSKKQAFETLHDVLASIKRSSLGLSTRAREGV